MSYLDDLIENGTGFQVQRSGGFASFSPVGGSEAELQAFQGVARALLRRNGQGYSVFKRHTTSDRAEDLYDLIMVAIG